MTWREEFHNNIAPELSTPGLEALATAIRGDDRRLIQNQTVSPPCLTSTLNWEVEGACAMALPGWLGDGLSTVQKVYENWMDRFNHKEVGAFSAWYDSVSRHDMRLLLLPEVEAEIQRRK